MKKITGYFKGVFKEGKRIKWPKKDVFLSSLAVVLCITIFAAMFLAHFIENVGMTIGLMPITGIPLPFVSYGGSSMLINCIAIGLVLSVNRKRKKNMFME